MIIMVNSDLPPWRRALVWAAVIVACWALLFLLAWLFVAAVRAIF